MAFLTALEPLKMFDPDTYALVSRRVAQLDPLPGPEDLTILTEAVIWALSVETGLGHAVAEGLLRLLASPPVVQAEAYIQRIRTAATTGATLARILAQHLPRVLLAGGRMEERFSRTLASMLGKGTYTLSMPLALLEEILAQGDERSAEAYLDLLGVVFSQSLSYNQSNRLAQHLPQAIRNFPAGRRAAQIGRMVEMARIDLDLIGAFIEGMPKGLALLPAQNLSIFVSQALACYRRSRDAGLNFMSLNSGSGQEACAALQVAVTLAEQKQGLAAYVRARLGRPVAVASMRSLGAAADRQCFVCSDSRSIYLREEIDHFAAAGLNLDLYKTLVRLEAGLLEEGCFDFDLERAADLFPAVAQWLHAHPPASAQAAVCDAERFLGTFPCRQAADDLLAVFELARVRRLMALRYPGLIRRVLPAVRQEAQHLRRLEAAPHPLRALYERVVLQAPGLEFADTPSGRAVAQIAAHFQAAVKPQSPAELSAWFTCRAYAELTAGFESDCAAYPSLALPFGHRPRWDLVSQAQAARSTTVLQIKACLQQQDLPLYRADLYQQLAQGQGGLSAREIVRLVLTRRPATSAAAALVKLAGLDWRSLLSAAGIELVPEPTAGGRVFYYPEWDHDLQDYLKDHVRVQESCLPTGGGDSFYDDTLKRRRGLIAHMRRAFELLKPAAVSLLRQWPEGDDFDYRALLDFVVDRRLGRIPSDRLFVKRLKQERSVAVLLLVDVSRSTANPVAGGHTTVLAVAREALVLFCEALQVVGDSYALAGFSGTGRHSVDYFPIKNFAEPLNDEVRQRIAALTPQRSTRMGAALRHATAVMQAVAARVRLIIIVSDGFPNDLGYKADYALADTRRAVQEARARQVHVKAITVNIGASPGLDEMYGRHHHRVISDVRELPGRLLRLYGALTKVY